MKNFGEKCKKYWNHSLKESLHILGVFSLLSYGFWLHFWNTNFHSGVGQNRTACHGLEIDIFYIVWCFKLNS